MSTPKLFLCIACFCIARQVVAPAIFKHFNETPDARPQVTNMIR